MRKHSPETIEKLREAALGRKHSTETKSKISKSNTGKLKGVIKPPRSIEHSKKISESRKKQILEGRGSPIGLKQTTTKKAMSASLSASPRFSALLEAPAFDMKTDFDS